MFTSSLFQKAYELTANSNTWNKTLYEEKVKALLAFNKANKGKDLLTPLTIYLEVLENTNPVLIPYLTDMQANKLLRDLQVTYLFLLAEKEYELTHQKKENSKKYSEYLRTCQILIDKIRYRAFCGSHHIKPSPEQGYCSEEKPVAYLGLFAGRAFAEEMVKMTSGSITKKINAKMGWLNAKRLYWVWTSSFIKTMLAILPDNFFFVDQAKATTSLPDPYTGTISWALYYFRFSLSLGLLLKHTIAGPWMSKEEQSEPWMERFKTQWQQRKFTLLNDFFWATGNMLCFFWLYGKGLAGAWGDMLTIALLVFDISLAVWDYEEQRTQHSQQMHDYEQDLQRLKKEIALLKKKEEKELLEREKTKLIELEIQYAALIRAQSKCAREWNYQKLHLAINITYAVSLMLSFVLLAAPLLPFAAATLSAMTVSGAVLCFAFSLMYNGMKGGIEINKIKMTIEELKTEQAENIRAFKELANGPSADENAKKLLFLKIKQLRIDKEYQERYLTLQIMHLMRSILMESMIPVVVFISLVFLPLGPGIGILAAAIALAVTSHLLINALFKAEKAELKEFNGAEYQQFCDNPDEWAKTVPSSLSFFKPSEEPAKEIDDDNAADYSLSME